MRELCRYLDSVRRTFDWRTFNCGHFVGGWVVHATGADPLAGLPLEASRGAWVRLVRQAGGLRALVTRQLGREALPAAQAMVGDVVLLPAELVGALGICAGRTAMFLDRGGVIVHVPMAEADCAWRVAA
jgi:hypothetical protein